ncbi:ATP synthase F0 subunit A [Candidatus Kaiserbacteria bacterium CG10_big_fil_rev_8_21_14_0_10_51_14]|uniref:ATP synthase subunit a n=1 Tax=Candidatus Kaiserbacteria bacterium CG10_big_fil_rev_8_21_14_0_10_51_14 TaxID=1974610 RepID=A0A2H0UCD9_9BACT|nr:MAG: ATP synthase F0 subunit A [Candidatus Kaiserbacteria bacterium CG10_big_fil_rev_8_21_14_0_10_51_14]
MEEGIHVAIAAEKLGEFFGIPITNTLVTSWVVIALLVITAFLVRGKLAMIPGKFQTLMETMVGFVYDYVTETLESRTMARRFFPLLMTIFLFIFIGNMLHFLPGIGSITYHDHPLLRAPNTDLTVPLVLALVSFFVIEITGILAIGFWKYSSKFIQNPFKNPIGFAVGIIELIGELVRVVSLSFRLFGNILAGEIIIAVAIFFAPYLLPVPLMLFEVFIGFLQAAIFALLTLFFIKLAIMQPEHH